MATLIKAAESMLFIGNDTLTNDQAYKYKDGELIWLQNVKPAQGKKFSGVAKRLHGGI